jgi:hypothetical protein
VVYAGKADGVLQILANLQFLSSFFSSEQSREAARIYAVTTHSIVNPGGETGSTTPPTTSSGRSVYPTCSTFCASQRKE